MTSILFNIPGEPSSVATTFDGYPMARAAGRRRRSPPPSARRLRRACRRHPHYVSRVLGGTGRRSPSARPNISRSISSPSPASSAWRAAPFKTWSSTAIGLPSPAIGIDTVSGSVRLTMAFDELVKGVSFVVAVMGLFGIGELADCGGGGVPGPVRYRRRSIGRKSSGRSAVCRTTALRCCAAPPSAAGWASRQAVRPPLPS